MWRKPILEEAGEQGAEEAEGAGEKEKYCWRFSGS